MGPTLAEYFQQAGIQRYPAFAPYVRLKDTPFKSQVQSLTLCVHHQWYGLLHETGAGKSVPAVATALHYIGMGNKVLVVTLAGLIYQFAESVKNDFQGVDKYVRVHVLDDMPAKRQKLFDKWDAEGSWPEMIVMSYERFAISKLYLVMKEKGYDVLITDESQKWKEPNRVFFQRIREFLGDPEQPETAFIPMTGTPMHTALTDCYPLISLLSPGKYGSFEAFENRHCVFRKIKLKEPRKLGRGRVQTSFRLLVGYKNHDLLNKNLYQRALRVMKCDIPELRDLKEPIIQPVPVKLSTEHLELYRKMLVQKFVEMEGTEVITALQEQELRQKILQIVTCPELFIPEGKKMENHVFQAIEDLIEQAVPDGKVILFLHFRQTIRFYADKLQRFNPALMYGEVSGKEREVMRDKFLNDPECKLLIAHPKSAGAGFNFQSVCHTSIFGEPTASPGDFKQAMDRVVRPGQVWACNIYIIKALSTVAPEAIKEMLRRDSDISRVTLDRKTLRHFYDVT